MGKIPWRHTIKYKNILTNVRYLNKIERKILNGECLERGNRTASRQGNEE